MHALVASWTFAVALAIAVPAQADAGVIDLIGDVALVPTPTTLKYAGGVLLSDPPSSSATAILFLERDGFVVPDFHALDPAIPSGSTLLYQISMPGTYEGIDLPDIALPIGSRVTTYVLHYDDPEQQTQRHTGSVTFDSPIAGIQVTFGRCSDCIPVDALFSPSNISIAESSGLELFATDDFSRDSIVLSADRRTVTFDFHTDNPGTEDMRIIFVPEPGVIPLFGGAILLASMFASRGAIRSSKLH